MAATDRQRLGAAGERLVARHYERSGYQVVARNWHGTGGEIDLVCRLGATLVICEVKTRRGDRYGTAAEAVTPAKCRRLRRMAAQWLSQTRPRGIHEVRFDVATVGPSGVDVLEAAF